MSDNTPHDQQDTQPIWGDLNDSAESAPINETKIVGVITCVVAGLAALITLLLFTFRPSAWRPVLIMLGIAAAVFLLGLRLFRGSLAEAEARAEARLLIPIEPTKRTAKGLTPGEKLFRETHMHPIVQVPWFGAFGLVTLMLIRWPTLQAMLAVWLIVGVAVLIRIGWWWQLRDAFTNTRLFVVKGLIGRSFGMMAYRKMTDETFTVPWHSVILAKLRVIDVPYGTFILESAGQDQAFHKVRWVPCAEILYRYIMGQVLPDDQSSES